MKKKDIKKIDYEVLNVANEVVFTGSGPDTLTWCNENKNIANTVREVGNSKVPALKMEVWCWLAGLVQNAIEKREEKKKKKEEQKEWRKKEKKQSKKQQTL